MSDPVNEQPDRAALDQRQQLADAYQGQALEHDDPGTANLQYLASDLLRLAAVLNPPASRTGGSLDPAALERRADRILRLTRQFTYMHRLVTQAPPVPARPARPGATAGAREKKES